MPARKVATYKPRLLSILWTCAGCAETHGLSFARQTTLPNGLFQIQDAHRKASPECPRSELAFPAWPPAGATVDELPPLEVRFVEPAETLGARLDREFKRIRERAD